MSIHALTAGQQCGPYTVVREIGRGGMAIVYLARAPDGKERAIKTLQFADRLSSDQTERFKLEIKVLANIDHVNVVRFFEAGRVALERSSLMWVALEYLRGETLRTIIDASPAGVDLEDGLRLCKQIADGVAAAHALGVIHRDLKPTNVAVVHDVAKVFDFGIAKFRRWRVKSTVGNQRIGTIGYMAPEQLSGKAVDARTDVYALGIILYELACGVHPICPRDLVLTPAEIIARTIGVKPTPLAQRTAGLPAAVSAIAERALAKDPADRFGDMSAMRDALDQALASYRTERRPQQMGALSGDWNVTALGTAPAAIAAAAPSPAVAIAAPPRTEPAKRERRVLAALIGAAAGALAGAMLTSVLRWISAAL